MTLSPRASELLSLLRSLGDRGFTEGMAFDLELIEGALFEDQEDVSALRELEATGLVRIDVYDPRCWTIGATLAR